MRNSIRTFLLLALIGFTGAGFVLRSDSYFLIKKNFSIFSEVFEQVSSHYIDEVDPEKLLRTGIDAMLDELDPYTVLIDETESLQMDIVTTGQYAGVGLEIGARGGQLVVIAPIEGYSAERRGVRAGDIIREVDGRDVSQMTTDDLQSLLRGDPGTPVTLSIKRFGMEELLHFELMRETIEVRNVTYYGLLDNDQRIGYILLRRFAQNAAEEVRNAILELQEEEPLDGLVLDLRNNPGGLLDEAVKIIDKFVPAGEKVVWTEGRIARSSQTYRTREDPVYPDQPLIVLQNSGSASASEIVSGALQDLDRAVVMGERSFGKGLVQVVQPLSYNISLKITTSKYFTPSGRSIQSSPFITHEDIMSMDQVPDSLRTRFSTRSGRTVYEGLGIEPDIIMAARQPGMLEIALLQNSLYFFFANEYTANADRSVIEDPDRIYTDFLNYLEERNFRYTSRAERHMNRFRESLHEDLVYDSNERLKALEELVELEKNLEKQRYAEYVRRELYLELLSRFEGRSGRMQVHLETDPLAVEAARLISSSEEYHALLKP